MECQGRVGVGVGRRWVGLKRHDCEQRADDTPPDQA